MATASAPVRAMGVDKCFLCGQSGTEKNPLERHHVDGNRRNNKPENWVALHSRVCHPFGDFFAQFHIHHKSKACRDTLKRAWQTFNWTD